MISTQCIKIPIEFMCFTLVCFTVMLIAFCYWIWDTDSARKTSVLHCCIRKSYYLFFQQLLCMTIYPFLIKPLFSQEIFPFSAPNNFLILFLLIPLKFMFIDDKNTQEDLSKKLGKRKPKNLLWYRGQQLEMCSSCVLHGLCRGTGRVSYYCCFCSGILWNLLFKWFC